jgi:polyisoprenoid-binding protein YceI
MKLIIFFVSNLLPILTLSQVKQTEAKFELVSNESRISWRGTTITGGGHEGTMETVSGTVFVSRENKVTKGNFTIDMNSIRNTDLRPDNGYQDLEKHLKDDDFFSVAKFPTAFFSITKIESSQKAGEFIVSGSLRLKGVTRPITFPSALEIVNDKIHAAAAFTIDRTLWGITYKSENILGLSKDDLISNDIKLSLDLVFKK